MTDDFRRQTFDIIQRLTGDRNVVVIPRLFVTLLEGDYIAAAILNQIVYWTDHTRDPDGWFYKSYDDWTAETGLSKYQVCRSINGDKRVKGEKVTLASVGVETKRKKAPNGAPTIHYRINREVFIDALAHAVNPIVNNVDYANVNNVDDGKSTNSTIHSEQSQPSSYTENTTEKKELAADAAKPAKPKKQRAPKADPEVSKAVGAVIKAWKDALPAEPISDVYQNRGIRKVAEEIHKAGYTPEQVMRYMEAQYEEPFWRGKYMKLEHVALNLPIWLASHNGVKPTATDRGHLDGILAQTREREARLAVVQKASA